MFRITFDKGIDICYYSKIETGILAGFSHILAEVDHILTHVLHLLRTGIILESIIATIVFHQFFINKIIFFLCRLGKVIIIFRFHKFICFPNYCQLRSFINIHIGLEPEGIDPEIICQANIFINNKFFGENTTSSPGRIALVDGHDGVHEKGTVKFFGIESNVGIIKVHCLHRCVIFMFQLDRFQDYFLAIFFADKAVKDLFCFFSSQGELLKIGTVIFDQTESYIFDSICFKEGLFYFQGIDLDSLKNMSEIFNSIGKISAGKISPGSLEKTVICQDIAFFFRDQIKIVDSLLIIFLRNTSIESDFEVNRS